MAYVVGSASVEIVPDFRNAQRKITSFFEGQGNSVKVPVDLQVDKQAAKNLRDEVIQTQREVTSDTRKQVIEREQMYSRFFDQIDKREQQSARAREAAELRAAKVIEQATKDAAKTQAQALKDRESAELRAAKVREGQEKLGAQIALQIQKDYAADYERLLKQRDLDERQAALSRSRAEREYAASVADIQADLLRQNKARLKEQESDERESARVRTAYLKDENEKIAALLKDVLNPKTGRVDFGSINTASQQAGADSGRTLGQALINNFRQEIRTRATFIGAVLAGVLIAAGPTFLASGAVLFGGLGLLATATSNDVKEAWRNTWLSIVKDTKDGASAFKTVHKELANSTRATFVALKPDIDAAFDAAAPLTEQFGEALLRATTVAIPGFRRAIEGSGPVITGFGDLFVGAAQGITGMLDALITQAPAAGATVSSLGGILAELLPALGQVLATGSTLASTVLPLISGATTLLNGALGILAPLLPLIAGGFAALFIGSRVTGVMNKVAQSLAGVTYSTSAFATAANGAGATAAGKLSNGISAMSKRVEAAGAALPLLGVAIALIASEMQDAEAQEQSWAQGILAGGAAAATAQQQLSDERAKYGDGFVGQLSYDIDSFFGLASSMDDARDQAQELLAAMPPLQRAQTIAAQAANELAYQTATYGENSFGAHRAARDNAEAQIALATAQREANIVMRDSVSSVDAAKAALEDYQAALLIGDVPGQTEALQRYREEVAESATEQRLLNAATADTVSSADAAKAALEDLTVALRNGDTEGAAESMSRYKRETFEAANEQSDLEDALYGTNEALEAQRTLVLSATDSGFKLRQATLDMREAQEDLATTLGDSEATTADIEQANLDFEQSLLDVANAAGDLAADSLPATATELERNRAQTDGTLERLIALRTEMGDQFPASLQTAITNLQNTRGNMDFARTAAGLLRDSIFGIPATRTTTLQADTSVAIQQIRDFLGQNFTATIKTAVNNVAGVFGFPNRAYGGPLPGASPTDRADNILFNGTAGEFVTQRPSVRKYGMPFMYAVNSGLFPTKLAAAGLSALGSNSFERAANNDRQSFANGGLILPYAHYNADLSGAQRGMTSAIDALSRQMTEAGATGPAGGGAVGGGWQAIAKIVQAAIPQARINSTYRPGDPGYHGRGKAVDFGFGGVPGGAGSQGLAKIASFLYSGYGKTLAELIYDGIYDSSPDVKNGRDHVYNSGTRAEHRNHVHAAVYDWGGALMPGLNLMLNNTGSTEYLSNNTAAINGFREMLGASGGMAMPRFNVGALDTGRGAGDTDMRSVTGLANYGTIITHDVDELARKAEASKRSSLAGLGLI